MSDLNATLAFIQAVADNVEKLRDKVFNDHDKRIDSLEDKASNVKAELNNLSLDVSNNSAFKGKHIKYHEKDEQRWGIPRYIKNHVAVFLVVAVVAGIFLTTFFGVTIVKVIKAYNTVTKISTGSPIEFLRDPASEDTLKTRRPKL